MPRPKRAILLTCVLAVAVLGCGPEPAADLQVERLPDVRPNLPAVPTIPPPPHPVQHGDGSYTIYGLRKQIRRTIDTDVEVTGYIVEIYQPPECPEGETCPRPIAPHLWVADTRGESDAAKRLVVVGYAMNHEEYNEARELGDRYEPPPPESGMIPIPIDFEVGNKVKISGRFSRVSGLGFNYSEGLLEYRGHTTLEAQTPTEGS